jgi:hypothetical protein
MDDLELVDLYALPRKTASLVDEDSIELPPGALSLEFLQAIFWSAAQPMARRLKAAWIAIQYESPKLAVTVQVNDEGIAAQLERAIARSRQADKFRANVCKAIEQPRPPQDDAAAVSNAALRRPMPIVSYRRHVIDHRDRDPTNNRADNLREATISQNAMNRDFGTRIHGADELLEVGVSKTRVGTYAVFVQGNYYGSYQSRTEANQPARQMRRHLYGDFALAPVTWRRIIRAPAA